MDEHAIRLGCLQAAIALMPGQRDSDTLKLAALDLERFVTEMEPAKIIRDRIVDKRIAAERAAAELQDTFRPFGEPDRMPTLAEATRRR